MFADTAASTLVPLTMSSAVIELDQYSPNWTLAEPVADGAEEPRMFITRVPFEAPFANTPLVQVSLMGFDIDHRDSARLRLRAESVSPTGFDLLVETWRATRVYKIEVGWFALGHQLAP